MQHSFHIPVMGLAFTIESPIKVARFGISSVISIIEDQLLEDLRKHYSAEYGLPYEPISQRDPDYRALRIAAYLNMVQEIVQIQMTEMRLQDFVADSELTKYFELLPDDSSLKMKYNSLLQMQSTKERDEIAEYLRSQILPGAIDVNIMAKVDKDNYADDGTLMPAEYSDASSELRGFATSKLTSSIVFSAGYNPRLFAYMEQFRCFFPDENGLLEKRVILKVSDYRSALIQGKILAKKGIWVSEFRIESGLNCGGHAFPSDGVLLGPVLEEFKQNRAKLNAELFELCQKAHAQKGIATFTERPEMRITVQGGVGNNEEHQFLLNYYGMDSIGWGSPFLLVPEATTVDEHTRQQLANAKKEDYYLSDASPLGVPFNNFRRTTSDLQRIERIEKGRPGSPCYKKFLSSNTEFTDQPICTASRLYQKLKLEALETSGMAPQELQKAIDQVTEKDCLCEGLGAPALLSNKLPVRHRLSAVIICPGPNLAYFSGTFSLKEMVDHIYGRGFIGNSLNRSHMFVNELRLYLDYFNNRLFQGIEELTEKSRRAKEQFRQNLLAGIRYYRQLLPELRFDFSTLSAELLNVEMVLLNENVSVPVMA
jgi:hypothetical protein